VASNGQGSAAAREAGTASVFLMMAVHIVNAHVLLGATRARAIPAVGRAGGSCTCHGGNLLFRLVS